MPISVAVAARRSFLLLRTRPGVGETPGRPASDIDVKVIARYDKVKSGRVPKVFFVRFKPKTTYDRALGLADYSNYAFDAVRHVGSCILDCVDTEKGVQRWKYIKYIAFKGKVND